MSELIVSLAINGVSMGVIYALIAMGLILLIRAVGILNFAQGDFLTLGAYVGLGLFIDMKLPLWGAFLASLLILFGFAMVFMFGVYWPLRNVPDQISIIIATMGASIVIKEILMLIFGGDPRPMRYFFTDIEGKGLKINVLGVTLQIQYVLIIVVGLLIIGAVFLIFEKMYMGKIMEAASQDKFSAELLGIPTIITIAITYALSVSIAGLAGFMIAPIYSVSTSLSSLQICAFAGVVIGGWGDIKGAVIGSVLVGLIQSFATLFFSTYKDAVVFIVMILFLLFRPQGLFGSKIGDKA